MENVVCNVDLPPELKGMVVREIAETNDLWNLRLSSRDWKSVADRELFKYFRMKPNDRSIRRFRDLANCEQISCHVRSLIVETIPDLNSTRRTEVLQDSISPPALWPPQTPAELASTIGELYFFFPKLANINLIFSADNMGHDNDGGGFALQPHATRQNYLANLFMSLDLRQGNKKDETCSVLPISSLTCTNLLKFTKSTWVDPFLAQRVLRSIPELNFSVRVKRDWVAQFDALAESQDNLRSSWLEPAGEMLTSLTVYMDTYWGAIPFLDFSNLRLPGLKRLSLGNYCFAYPSQIAWVATLTALEFLSLDDCPIVVLIDTDDYLLEDGMTASWTTRSYDREDRRFFVNNARWHQYFTSLGDSLPNLKHLSCGHGQWEDPRRDSGDETEYFRRAFERRHALGTDIHSTRYVVFVGRRSHRSHGAWLEVHSDHPDGNELPRRAQNRLIKKIVDPANVPELTHANRVKDEEALRSLYEVLQGRRKRDCA